MSKITFFIGIFCLSAVITFGQQVPRNMVVVEVGTGTWCQYCPGAAMGCDDLIAYGYDVAIVKYHSGDSYANTYSNARVSYYGISGFPTAFFDGMNAIVGGSTTQSMFPQYSAKVNQRMAVMSSFTISLEGSHQCLTDFTANITVEKVAANSSANLRLHAVLTEKHIPEFWQGMTEVNYATRLMIPNQNGTAVSFDGGDVQNFNLQFSLDPSWVFEECEMVVFLQDQATKEIFQATKLALPDFTPEFEFDASVKNLYNLPKASCSGMIEPEVKIRNIGSEIMTSVNIFYKVNNGAPQVFEWTGTLDYLSHENVVLPAITFTGNENNEVLVYTSDPNGNTDQCSSNDAISVIVPEAINTPNTVKLILRTDINPGETTWELKNSSGEVLFSGGPYSTSGQMVQETFDLEEEDCYSFIINDTGGDGLINPGFVMLYYGSNTVIYQGGAFTYSELVEFNTDDPVGIEVIENTSAVQVFPNPVLNKINLALSLEGSSPVSYRIFSVTGQIMVNSENMMMEAGQQNISIDASAWNPGLYIYRVLVADQIYTGKITVR